MWKKKKKKHPSKCRRGCDRHLNHLMDLLTSHRDDVTAVKRSKDQIDSQPRQSDFISPYYSGLINPLQSHGAGILALAQNFSPALHMSVCHLVIRVDCHTCHNSLLLPRE